VLLGVATASGQLRVVLATGVAAALAEAVSMAAVAYTTSIAKSELYESERARERRHIRAVPKLERQEVRDIYAAKGFSGELLDRIVETITANEDVWLAVMMAEEHQLVPIERREAVRSAVIVGLAALIGSLVPIVPFMFLPMAAALWASGGVAALTLFAAGAVKARLTVGNPVRRGFELAMIGLVSAAIGGAIGWLLGVGPGGG
jgi:vacuolar iron transporter family protein